jgi:hypothetical protein
MHHRQHNNITKCAKQSKVGGAFNNPILYTI